jgi:DNA-binding NarL/FixJ family response regulator
MDSNTVLPISNAKRGAHSNSKMAKLPGASVRTASAASLQELKTDARRCHSPKQFRELLKHLQTFIPYSKFAGVWGYPSRTTIRFIFNQGFSRDLMRWRLTTGALWTSPLFHEWLRTKQAILWCDAVKRLKAQFDPELLRRMKEAGAEYALCGGFASPDYYVLFAAAMPSAASGRAHLKQFGSIVPFLVQASQRAYPRALLTKRETAVLERRAMGEITKQIGMSEGISERTIREHFQRIKKKLYTDDLVNAVVIAVKSGMLLPNGRNKGASQDSQRGSRGSNLSKGLV